MARLRNIIVQQMRPLTGEKAYITTANINTRIIIPVPFHPNTTTKSERLPL